MNVVSQAISRVDRGEPGAREQGPAPDEAAE